MSTYEEFMIILTAGLLIIGILNIKKEIAVLLLRKADGYFYSLKLIRRDG